MAKSSYTNPLTDKSATLNARKDWLSDPFMTLSGVLLPNPLTNTASMVSLTGGFDGYKFNNAFRWGIGRESVEAAIDYVMRNGYDGSTEDRDALKQYLKQNGIEHSDRQLKIIMEDVNTFLDKNDINLNDLNEYYRMGGTYENPNPELLTPEGRAEYQKKLEEDAQKTAFDVYYNDLFSLNEGTLGANMLQSYEEAERNAALSNMQLAEAQYQQAAMQQAETVKNITEQVKAERMAKLRAGMSEAQIANQEMQVMLNNTNTLNQQMNAMNQNQLAARQQYDLAQDTAYQQYINSATNMGNIGAAYSAAGAGSLDYVAKQLQANSKGKLSYLDAVKIASGQNNK